MKKHLLLKDVLFAAAGVIVVICCILMLGKKQTMHVTAIQVIRYQESHSVEHPGLDYPIEGLSISKASLTNNSLLWDNDIPDFYMNLEEKESGIVIKYYNCRDHGDIFVSDEYRLLENVNGHWEELIIESEKKLMATNVPLAGKSTGFQDGSLTDGSVTMDFPVKLEKGRYRFIVQANTFYQPYTWWYAFCDFQVP